MLKEMNLCFVTTLFMLSCKQNSQEKQEFYPNGKLKSSYQVDAKGRRHGFYKVYYDNGVLEKKLKFKNGIITDTSFFYEKSGKLSVVSIFANGEKERLKDIFYYSNEKIKEERTFFVGTGKISAYISYTPQGKRRYSYGDSKLVEIREVDNSKFKFKLIGQPQGIDSVTVYFFETANHDLEPYRSDRSFKKDQIVVSVKDSDYINDTLNIGIAVYNFEDNYPNLEIFPIQMVKNKKAPRNNLVPIYGNQK